MRTENQGNLLIVHRLIRLFKKAEPVYVITKGDFSFACDLPIPADCVLGKVTQIRKKHFRIYLDGFSARLFNIFMLYLSLSGILAIAVKVVGKIRRRYSKRPEGQSSTA